MPTKVVRKRHGNSTRQCVRVFDGVLMCVLETVPVPAPTKPIPARHVPANMLSRRELSPSEKKSGKVLTVIFFERAREGVRWNSLKRQKYRHTLEFNVDPASLDRLPGQVTTRELAHRRALLPEKTSRTATGSRATANTHMTTDYRAATGCQAFSHEKCMLFVWRYWK